MSTDTTWLRDLGITPEIEAAVRDYERQRGGASATRGLAMRVFSTIHRCGGVDQIRTMSKIDLGRVKDAGRKTIQALVDLGLSSSPAVAGIVLGADPQVDAAVQALVTSAIAWRGTVELVAGNPHTQDMLDKLDALVILLDGRKP